jgi:hypothetical protein
VEFFARLEAHGFAGCDADLGACAGVAANPGFAGADAEDAKPAQFDALQLWCGAALCARLRDERCPA